jgi:ketosteroid isomerase-like protein
MTMGAEAVTRRFVEAINRQDVEGLCELMTDDHRFVDGGRQVCEGQDVMREGWEGYFRRVPDYTIEISETFGLGATVVLLGRARGAYTSDGSLRPKNRWETPAAWKAIAAGDKVAHWQVFADNETLRVIIDREKAGTSHD